MDIMLFGVYFPLVLLSLLVTYLAHRYASSCWPDRFQDEAPFVLTMFHFNILGGVGMLLVQFISTSIWLGVLAWLVTPLLIGGFLWCVYKGIQTAVSFFHNLGERVRDEADYA